MSRGRRRQRRTPTSEVRARWKGTTWELHWTDRRAGKMTERVSTVFLDERLRQLVGSPFGWHSCSDPDWWVIRPGRKPRGPVPNEQIPLDLDN